MVGTRQRNLKVATKRSKRHMAAPSNGARKRHMAAPSNGTKLRKFGISCHPLTRTTRWRRRISKRREPMRRKQSKFKAKKPQPLRLLISRLDRSQLKRLQWATTRRLSMLDQPTMPKTPLTSQGSLRILSSSLQTRALLPRTLLLRTLFPRELLNWLLLTRTHPWAFLLSSFPWLRITLTSKKASSSVNPTTLASLYTELCRGSQTHMCNWIFNNVWRPNKLFLFT